MNYSLNTSIHERLRMDTISINTSNVQFYKGDSGQVIHININNLARSIDSYTGKAVIKTPGNLSVEKNIAIEAGVARFLISDDLTSEVGIYQFQIILEDNDERVATAIMRYYVKAMINEGLESAPINETLAVSGAALTGKAVLGGIKQQSLGHKIWTDNVDIITASDLQRFDDGVLEAQDHAKNSNFHFTNEEKENMKKRDEEIEARLKKLEVFKLGGKPCPKLVTIIGVKNGILGYWDNKNIDPIGLQNSVNWFDNGIFVDIEKK